ncbi:uncharacterized protein LOC144640993 [Oculina patagonica]
MNSIEDILQVIVIGLPVAIFLLDTGRGLKALEVCKECLIFLNNNELRKSRKTFNLVSIYIYQTIFWAYCLIPDFTNAIHYGCKLLDFYRECGEIATEGNLSATLANMCEQQYKYEEARELYRRTVNITREAGDRNGEAYAQEKCGIISYRLCEYEKAEKYLSKALAIRIEIGDREGEANNYGNLGAVFRSFGEYDKAKEYLERALTIRIEIGDIEGEAADYGNLGVVLQSLGVYDKAKEYLEKALTIRKKNWRQRWRGKLLWKFGNRVSIPW